MKIIDRRRSLETCTEAGWDADDYLLDSPIDEQWIASLKGLDGSFLYLKTLKKPFFKVESHHTVLKGIKGNTFFRLAYHRDHKNEAEHIIRYLNGEL